MNATDKEVLGTVYEDVRGAGHDRGARAVSGDTRYRGFVVRVAPGATAGRWWWSVLQHDHWLVATDIAPNESNAYSAARRWIDDYMRRRGA